ncbi:MAG: hypothetical protein Q9201_003599 [Fulgogasparrea decipioides]
MAPKATYEFFIPSIHDDIALACRIYSLPELYFGGARELEATGDKLWTPKGAIIAHPYTRLGGSYDDPVVLGIVEELMRGGFTVGTFNLRGTGKSKGRCSWTSKPELEDYISFVGFFMYYLSGVYPPVPGSDSFDDCFGLAPVLSGVPSARPPAHLLLSGYSYGAFLTRHLPNVPVLLNRFSKALKTSTQAEIRRRAASLAGITAIDILTQPLHSVPVSRNVGNSSTPITDDNHEAHNGQLEQRPCGDQESTDAGVAETFRTQGEKRLMAGPGVWSGPVQR